MSFPTVFVLVASVTETNFKGPTLEKKVFILDTERTHVCKAAFVALMRFLSVIFSSINKALVSWPYNHYK